MRAVCLGSPHGLGYLVTALLMTALPGGSYGPSPHCPGEETGSPAVRHPGSTGQRQGAGPASLAPKPHSAHHAGEPSCVMPAGMNGASHAFSPS